MKKLSFILAFLMSSFIWAQEDNFHGVITFEYTYEDVSAQFKPRIAMQPTSAVLEARDGISKLTIPNAMGGETIIISENSSGDMITLLDIMGMKFAIKSNPEKEEEETDEEEEKPEIIYHDEEKEIAGYMCKKATVEQGDTEVVIYYTEEIKGLNGSAKDKAEKINGFPLMIKTITDDYTSIQTAKSVEKKKVKKLKMQVPGGYEETTREELQKKMQGM